MNLQSALSDLMKVFLAFYIGSCAVGRADIPTKLVTQMRVKAMAGIGKTRSWGCPSITPGHGDCMSWRATDYR